MFHDQGGRNAVADPHQITKDGSICLRLKLLHRFCIAMSIQSSQPTLRIMQIFVYSRISRAKVENVTVSAIVQTKYTRLFSGLVKFGSMPGGGDIAGPLRSACFCCEVAMVKAAQRFDLKNLDGKRWKIGIRRREGDVSRGSNILWIYHREHEDTMRHTEELEALHHNTAAL